MPKIAATIVLALVWGLVATVPSAQAASRAAPTVADVTAPHPRMMENGAGFASLTSRVTSDDVSASLYSTVLKNADAMLTAPVVTYSKPDGARLLDTSRLVLDRSYTLMVAWKVSGDNKYADRLWRDLDAASGFPDWNPDHFLDTAEMTHAFAVAYDWGYSYWDSSKQAQLRQAILDKGLAPSLKVYDATTVNDAPYKYGGNWSMRADNVNIVVNSGMAMGALAVANDTTSALPQQILDKSFASIQVGLRRVRPGRRLQGGPDLLGLRHPLPDLLPRLAQDLDRQRLRAVLGAGARADRVLHGGDDRPGRAVLRVRGQHHELPAGRLVRRPRRPLRRPEGDAARRGDEVDGLRAAAARSSATPPSRPGRRLRRRRRCRTPSWPPASPR